jgi:hypothetical protein
VAAVVSQTAGLFFDGARVRDAAQGNWRGKSIGRGHRSKKSGDPVDFAKLGRRTDAREIPVELGQPEVAMRYMMLIYTKEGDAGQLSPEEAQQIRERHAAVMRETRERGMLVAVNGLGKTNTATTVRVDGGTVLTTDGPFAETKEQLAGYYVLDCVDLDEAIYWAGRIPSSCGGANGSIEIRQLVEFEGVPESMLKPYRVAAATAAD